MQNFRRSKYCTSASEYMYRLSHGRASFPHARTVAVDILNRDAPSDNLVDIMAVCQRRWGGRSAALLLASGLLLVSMDSTNSIQILAVSVVESDLPARLASSLPSDQCVRCQCESCKLHDRLLQHPSQSHKFSIFDARTRGRWDDQSICRLSSRRSLVI